MKTLDLPLVKEQLTKKRLIEKYAKLSIMKFTCESNLLFQDDTEWQLKVEIFTFKLL